MTRSSEQEQLQSLVSKSIGATSVQRYQRGMLTMPHGESRKRADNCPYLSNYKFFKDINNERVYLQHRV